MGPHSQPGPATKTLVRFDQRPHAGFVRSLAQLPRALLERLLLWQQRASERTHLERLSARDLKDIGLTRAETRREFEKPFWRG